MAEEMTFPNENFTDEIDYLGYRLTMEHIGLMIQGPNATAQDVLDTKARMRVLLSEYGEKKYDEGVTAGISLGQAFND